MNKENYIEQIRAHDSGYKHVSGYVEYTDDIKELIGILYGAIGLTKKAHAIIKKIDLSEVYKSKGVILVVTYKDIFGRNDVGLVFDGDLIFLKNKREFYGKPFICCGCYFY
jgi:Xanthine dehydrogenase, molybdopterin-binding subunit B